MTPDQDFEARNADLQRRWDEQRKRRAEARRLVDLAKASGAKFRVLTVTCAQDHRLADVYRINGLLAWEGKFRGQVVREQLETTGATLESSNLRFVHEVGCDLVRPDRVDKLAPDPPKGSCACGTFSVSGQWIVDTLTRTDLPKSRRVVAPAALNSVR